jgi:oligopeptide transport system substrate-binding protein
MWLTDGGNNYTGFASPEYDLFIADAARAPSAMERRAIFQKAEEMLLDEMPVLPIYFYTARYLIDPRVREWHPTILNHHPYKHVYLEED